MVDTGDLKRSDDIGVCIQLAEAVQILAPYNNILQ